MAKEKKKKKNKKNPDVKDLNKKSKKTKSLDELGQHLINAGLPNGPFVRSVMKTYPEIADLSFYTTAQTLEMIAHLIPGKEQDTFAAAMLLIDPAAEDVNISKTIDPKVAQLREDLAFMINEANRNAKMIDFSNVSPLLVNVFAAITINSNDVLKEHLAVLNAEDGVVYDAPMLSADDALDLELDENMLSLEKEVQVLELRAGEIFKRIVHQTIDTIERTAHQMDGTVHDLFIQNCNDLSLMVGDTPLVSKDPQNPEKLVRHPSAAQQLKNQETRPH